MLNAAIVVPIQQSKDGFGPGFWFTPWGDVGVGPEASSADYLYRQNQRNMTYEAAGLHNRGDAGYTLLGPQSTVNDPAALVDVASVSAVPGAVNSSTANAAPLGEGVASLAPLALLALLAVMLFKS